MADKKIMVDTSILIDYFRKTDKTKTRLVSHFRKFNRLYISVITEFEIFNGAKEVHLDFWKTMLTRFVVIDFDSISARKAAEIVAQLKTKRKSIDKPDLFIAATAVTHGLILDTHNIKHFIDIENLDLFAHKNGS